MRKFSKTSIAAPIVALLLSLGVAATASPAVALPSMGHAPIRIPHGGFPHGGVGPRGHFGRGVGPGLFGGFAAGAIIGSATAPYYYDNGCYQYQPVYDQWGHYLGRQLVDVCQ